MSEDRTIAPSRRRIEQAREAGQVAQSRELTAAAAMAATTAAWSIWFEPLSEALVGILRGPFGSALPLSPDIGVIVEHAAWAAWSVAGPMAGLLGSGIVAALLAQQIQVGGLFVPGLAMPDTRRLGVLGGGGSDRSLGARLQPSMAQAVRLAAAVAVVWLTLRGQWPGLVTALERPWPSWLPAAGAVVQSVMGRLAAVLLIAGLADLALQWRQWHTRMQSTPEEHRQEQRTQDGDPATRSRRRGAARRLRAGGPSAAVAGIEARENV